MRNQFTELNKTFLFNFSHNILMQLNCTEFAVTHTIITKIALLFNQRPESILHQIAKYLRLIADYKSNEKE